MNTKTLKRWTALAAFAVLAGACDDDDGGMMEPTAVDLVATAEAAGSFNTLLAALDAAGLRNTLATGGPFTVFAPTDDAFNALPAGTVDALLADPPALAEILLYHVVEGDLRSGTVASSSFIPTLNGQAVTVGAGATIDGAAILSADVEASNGVIHVIDQVLLPSDENIVEIAAGNGAFNTLVTAVGLADLVSTLEGDGPFTVFAPTDDAFAAVPSETLDAILDDVDLLTQVLTYHVVSGRVLSSDVVGLTSATTLNGNDVSVAFDGTTVSIDDATVTATDIQGTNGVIHVIDSVLLPPDLELP